MAYWVIAKETLEFLIKLRLEKLRCRRFLIGKPLAIYRGLSGPPGPKPQKVWKKSDPPSLEKVSKKSGESGKSLEKVPKDFFETFSRLSGGSGAGGPRETFSDFVGFRARRARETPVNGQQVPNFLSNFRVVKTVFLENGVFVPYRKQVVLTKNGENDDLHSTHKNKGLRSSEPRNRRKWRKWRVSLGQNQGFPKTGFSPPWQF